MSRNFLSRGGRIRTGDLHVPNVVTRGFVVCVGVLTSMFVPAATAVEALPFHTVPRSTIAHDAPAFVAHHGEHDPAATVGLYGIYSGFAKARLDRKSITVGPLPDSLNTEANREILDRALDEWNMAAGWEIFVPDFDGGDQDVQFVQNADETCPNYGACTGWDQFSTGWYRHCYVMLHEWMPPLETTLAHELGHCLGFEDVPTTDTGYFGIMSYARQATLYPNNEQDAASLVAADYTN